MVDCGGSGPKVVCCLGWTNWFQPVRPDILRLAVRPLSTESTVVQESRHKVTKVVCHVKTNCRKSSKCISSLQ